MENNPDFYTCDQKASRVTLTTFSSFDNFFEQNNAIRRFKLMTINHRTFSRWFVIFSLNLLIPSIGCENFKELSAEADRIVNMILVNNPTNRDELLDHVKHLRIRDAFQDTGEQDVGDVADKYANFEQLYSDSVQSGNPSLLSFAEICKSIYEDSHPDRQKAKVAVHLLFREVFQRLQDLTKIMRKSELQAKEFEERRKALDLDQETKNFFSAHETLGGAQGLQFPSTWGQGFSLFGSDLDTTHVH